MNFGRILLLTGLALVALLSFSKTSEAALELKHCEKGSHSYSTPAACEETCNVWCWDRLAEVSTTNGECAGPSTTSCTLIKVEVYRGKERKCDCPFLGGTCKDKGVSFTGTKKYDSCIGAAGPQII